MGREAEYIEEYLERSVAVFYAVSTLFVLVALEALIYTDLVLKRQHATAASEAFIESLRNSRVAGGILFVVIYLGLLVGGFIRAVVRLVDPENPLGVRASLSVSAFATLAYYLLRFLGIDLLILATGGIPVDLSGVTDGKSFLEALNNAISSRSSAHPKASAAIVAITYAATGLYLGLIRYLVYKLRDVRVATYSTAFVLALMLVGVLRCSTFSIPLASPSRP